ncbi:MAG: PQQ-dependent sugar dehydrogenase [Bacteroidota bacterium]
MTASSFRSAPAAWRYPLLLTLIAAFVACSTPDPASAQDGNRAPGGAANSQQSVPGTAAGAPVETAPPNVPEFEPAFLGQTRAPAVQTETELAVETIAEGLVEPWAIAFLPDGRMLVTEKPGRLRIVSTDGALSAPIEGIPDVDARRQGGLLDVEPAPTYAADSVVYVSYSEPREGGNGLAVARGRLVESEDTAPRLDRVEVVFRMMPTLESTLHSGGRLVWAEDGHLFVTLGERSVLEGRHQAQDLGSHFGKIVRVRADGAVPPDNPFVDTEGARPEIWSSGHRNVLAAAFDADGQLWEVEMGPQGGDELNLVRPGLDYGWPTIGYGEEYSGQRIHRRTQAEGMEQPVYYWDPVISPSGMTFYSGRLVPEWAGNAFIGGLSSRALVRVVIDGERVVGEERLLTDLGERIREVVEGPDGALYLATDDRNGRILRVAPRD